MAWTRFMDMHSGGETKVYQLPDGSFAAGSNWHQPEGGVGKEFIYIEAPEGNAKIIFYNRFGHNPERVTCTCCGEDYSISEAVSFEIASGYDRGCAFEDGEYVDRPNAERRPFASEYVTAEEYRKRPDVLTIPADEILEAERIGDVPSQGYVWVG